jgi:mannose-6-phosphate isomerase-like protein (cupin superfamily)
VWEDLSVPVVDVPSLPVVEPRPGWRARFFHSGHMTFAYYEIAADSTVHVHQHHEEEVWHLLEGELEISLSGDTRRLHPGQAVVVAADEHHGVRALRASRAIVVDHPVRASVGGLDTGATSPGRATRARVET